MKYIKKFNENKISILDSSEWVKLLPKELNIITDNGEFTLKVKSLDPELGYPGVYNLMNSVSFIYVQNTVESSGGDVSADGEPDNLQFDIAMVKDNDGLESNPSKSLRLNIDITYGDAMVYEFTIDYPNKVGVHHYTGKHSLHDSETYWGFSDESLKQLVDFFNRFGFETTTDDYKFMDKDPDSYEYKKDEVTTDINKSSLSDRDDVKDLKGGNMVNIKSFENFKK
jgi:hypothetical protein